MTGKLLDNPIPPAKAGQTRFAPAAPEDEAGIRRLLRENPMAGRIAITLEREPDYFADARLPATEKQTMVAREDGRVVCAGSCAIREHFINGEPRRVGYLGGLRLDATLAGRFDIVRRGYEFFRETQAGHPASFYYTSIAADNLPALRFLERGLPGMPAYELVGEFVTVLAPVRRRLPALPAQESDPVDLNEVADFMAGQAPGRQFAPRWTATDLSALSAFNLNTDDFCVVREDGRIIACAALWDQRAFKQTVIHGYAPWLRMTRPLINIAARLAGTQRLPGIGSTVAHAFVSHLAVAPERVEALVELVARLGRRAAGRGIEWLTLGLAAGDPRLAVVRRRFGGRAYRSRLYIVRWPGLGDSAQELDGRRPGPEVALL